MPDVTTVASAEDWAALRDRRVSTVIDPAVIRIAGLFFDGPEGPLNREDTAWPILRANIQSLAAFVDAVVLERGISVFDYALNPLGDRFTYLSAMWSENAQAVPDLRVVEFLSPVLIPVRVVDPVWTQLHLKAGATLAFANAIQPDRAEELGRELRTTSWGQWENYDRFGTITRSRLQEFQATLQTDNRGERYVEWLSDVMTRREHERESPNIEVTVPNVSEDPIVNMYLHVAQLFGLFAGELNGTQVLSPAQSRAVLLASTGPAATNTSLTDAVLFAELTALMNTKPPGYERSVELEQPSFLPYLLSRGVKSPIELFERAVELRDNRSVRNYSKWLHDARLKLSGGRLTTANEREIRRAGRAVERTLDVKPLVTSVSLDVGPMPSAGVSAPIDLSRARDWVLSVWPGKRYRRVLLKLALSQREYIDLGAALERVWLGS